MRRINIFSFITPIPNPPTHSPERAAYVSDGCKPIEMGYVFDGCKPIEYDSDGCKPIEYVKDGCKPQKTLAMSANPKKNRRLTPSLPDELNSRSISPTPTLYNDFLSTPIRAY